MYTNTRHVTIEWGDCDPAGIVFYPRYFAFFDSSTQAMFASVGLPKFELQRIYDIVGYPMVDTRAKFYIPSKYGDDVTIETTVTAFRRSSFDVHHRLMKGDKIAVEGFETRVWVARDPENPEGIKALPIPAEVIAKFSA